MLYEVLEVYDSGGPPLAPLEPFRGSSSVATFAVSSPEGRSLQQAKNEIDLFYKEGKWDDYKKITNPFEYIFLSWNRRTSRSVATRAPLSRSYFKMIELWKRLDLSNDLEDLVERDGGLITAHAAEGPGGFIEACAVSATAEDWTFKSTHAITLRSDAKNIPGWRKASSFLELHPQIAIHSGADGTGNILIKANQDAFVDTVRTAHPAGTHLFTADGGFDFSNDYNAQEDLVFPLLLAESLLGLRTLAKGGCLVIKCFDTLEQPTLDLIWILGRAFRTWGLVKPRTSRAGNAERYIVGKGYLGDNEDIVELLTHYQALGEYKQPILKTPSTHDWRPALTKISAFQMKIEHHEYTVIQETLHLIKHTEPMAIKMLVRANVLRSIEWCREHREEVALAWTEDLERSVTRESNDLLHILSSTNSVSYTGWTRSTSSTMLSFSGFREGTLSSTAASNPFMRLKPR
jgi:23S rRNA U2552 (ribose-2'-O)-methylase RlmE/FtsJ